MTVEEFAGYKRLLGERVVSANGVFWRRVRPFFYRPLLPYLEYQPQSVSGPFMAFLGGFQHAVPPHASANSLLNLLICDDPASYSLGVLDRHERREIKRAAEHFTVSMVTDVKEFKAQAYRVYRSFYERTRYEYKSERRHEGHFSRWVDSLFQNRKVIVLGAYGKDHALGAVGIWHLVEDTMVYSTFFCDTESLRKHATGLMLHTMREAAAGSQTVKRMFIGNYKYSAATGVDDFYLARGCKLIRKPALIHLNPLAAPFLKHFAPEQYGRLIGDIKGAQDGLAVEPGMPGGKPSLRMKTS